MIARIVCCRLALAAAMGARPRRQPKPPWRFSPAAASGAWKPTSTRSPGVISTTSGYIGGTPEQSDLRAGLAGGTGHAEAVEIVYDPAKVSYAKLLDVFWHNIDPLAKDKQFCDHGDQYRSAIFYHDEEQKKLAEETKKAGRGEIRAAQPVYTADRPGRRVLQGRGLPPGLLQEESDPLQILPLELRTRPAARGVVGQEGLAMLDRRVLLAAAGAFALIAALRWLQTGEARRADANSKSRRATSEWRAPAQPAQYDVLRMRGTEAPARARSTRRSARALSCARAATCRCSPRRRSSTAGPAGRASSAAGRTRSAPRPTSLLHAAHRSALPPLRRAPGPRLR